MEKKSFIEKILPCWNRVLIDVMLLGIFQILAFMLPVATYVYKKKMYVIKGLRFLTGATIMKGKTTIEPNIWAILMVVVAVIVIITGVLFIKIKAKYIGTVLLVLSVAEFVFSVVLSKAVVNILSEAKGKSVSLAAGSIIMVVFPVLMIIRSFHILYVNKAVSALDFMALPGALYFLINNYFPMFGIFIAFKKIDYSVGIWGSDWVGLSNFKYLFATQDAWIMTRNTILYNAAFIVVGMVVGILIAIMLYEIVNRTWQKIFQTTILLPQLISMIIVAYIVYGFLSNEAGFINKAILGDANAIDFYSSKQYWPGLLLGVNTWKLMGYNGIIFLSSIAGINKSLYEAAKVDGASKMQQIFRITLPLLKPTVITLLIMQVGRIFYSDFGLFLQVPMSSGVLYSVTQTIDTYVYRALMTLNQIGKASAASVYQSVVGFVIVLVANGIVRKLDRENAMF